MANARRLLRRARRKPAVRSTWHRTSGLNNLWQSVMGNSFDRPTLSSRAARDAGQLVDEAMHEPSDCQPGDDAPPGSLATTEDVIALCRVVAAAPTRRISATKERAFSRSSERPSGSDVRRKFRSTSIHLKIADQTFWGRIDEIVRLINDARKEGLNVQANVYPYTRGNNNWSASHPAVGSRRWTREAARTTA